MKHVTGCGGAIGLSRTYIESRPRNRNPGCNSSPSPSPAWPPGQIERTAAWVWVWVYILIYSVRPECVSWSLRHFFRFRVKTVCIVALDRSRASASAVSRASPSGLCQDTHLSLVSCMSCMYPACIHMLLEKTPITKFANRNRTMPFLQLQILYVCDLNSETP